MKGIPLAPIDLSLWRATGGGGSRKRGPRPGGLRGGRAAQREALTVLPTGPESERERERVRGGGEGERE